MGTRRSAGITVRVTKQELKKAERIKPRQQLHGAKSDVGQKMRDSRRGDLEKRVIVVREREDMAEDSCSGINKDKEQIRTMKAWRLEETQDSRQKDTVGNTSSCG